MHSVIVDELLCCESIEAVHKLLFVKQEILKPSGEGAAACYAGLVQLIQLPDHCNQEIQYAKAF